MKAYLRGAAALAALAAFAGLDGVANAADVDYTPPPAYSWSGLYVGGFVGAGASVADTEAGADFGEIGGFDVDLDGIGGEGLLGGAMAGFNWQVSDRFLLGIQGDIAWTDLDAELELGGSDAEAGPDFIASASLRAGFLVTPETLFYAIGGYSYSEYEAEADGIDDDFDEEYDGYHVGVGMETRLSDRLTARVEYRYTDFGGEDWDTDGLLDIAPSVHTGTLGIAYNLFPVAGEGEVASPAADVMEPQVSWTGLYVGVNGGAGAVVNRIEVDELDGLDFDGIGGEGILGSLMAGFNWQVGDSFVIGIQGDIGLSDMKSKLDASADIDGGGLEIEGDIDAKAEMDWFANASLRLGWLPSPETMLYVIGGYSYAHFKASASGEGFIDVGDTEIEFVFDEKAKQSFDGFHVGTGIESMLADNLTLRVEYRYTQYGKEKGLFGFDEGVFEEVDTAPSTHVGTVGIAWLFNSL
ncbi:MAG: outer membrane protein [Parvibaculaceae bacterium]|jgi:outer membrane immunogenic protein